MHVFFFVGQLKAITATIANSKRVEKKENNSVNMDIFNEFTTFYLHNSKKLICQIAWLNKLLFIDSNNMTDLQNIVCKRLVLLPA